jgi:enoyl-[acyl-carrier-protein] reductase (NADH)
VAEGLAKEFTGVKVKAYQCDVTDQKRVGEVFKLVGEEFEGGIIHGVVAVSKEACDCLWAAQRR